MVDDVVADGLGAPRDAGLGADFEVFEGDFAVLADPGGGGGEHFEVGEGVDRAFLHGGAAGGEGVVELELRVEDLHEAGELLVELGLLFVDFGADAGA